MANNTKRIRQRERTERSTKYGRDGSVDCVGLECIDDSVLIRLVSYLISIVAPVAPWCVCTIYSLALLVLLFSNSTDVRKNFLITRTYIRCENSVRQLLHQINNDVCTTSENQSYDTRTY